MKIFTNLKPQTMNVEEWITNECLGSDKIAVIASKDVIVLTNSEGDQYLMQPEKREPKERKPREPKKVEKALTGDL